MKTLYLLTVIFSFCLTVSHAQKHTEAIVEERAFRSSDGMEMLYIDNIYGSVEVVGTKSDQLVIEVKKNITAKAKADLEKGIEEIQLEIVELDDGYYVYIKTAYSSFDAENRRLKYENCGSDWDDYDFRCDFKVRVPEKVKLYASTVNNGNVLVEDIIGDHKVTNVNGSITMINVSGNTIAQTVNGDVDVTYKETPTSYCTYETINGDITVNVTGSLSAEIEVDTFNGEFFTSYKDVRAMANKVERSEEAGEGGMTYKVSSKPVFKIGDGELKLSFSSFNGDMYLLRM